jgi:hypothetical protein
VFKFSQSANGIFGGCKRPFIAASARAIAKTLSRAEPPADTGDYAGALRSAPSATRALDSDGELMASSSLKPMTR